MEVVVLQPNFLGRRQILGGMFREHRGLALEEIGGYVLWRLKQLFLPPRMRIFSEHDPWANGPADFKQSQPEFLKSNNVKPSIFGSRLRQHPAKFPC